MTQQTVIANVLCNSLQKLYTILLKKQGGFCTKKDFEYLKSNLKIIYNTQFINCEQTLLSCNTNDNNLNNCSVIQNTCSNLFPGNMTYTSSGNYIFTVPLFSNVTYNWSLAPPYNFHTLAPSGNTCVAEANDSLTACKYPINIRCTIIDNTYNCTVIKSLSLDTNC